MTDITFTPWPKIPRLRRDMIVTEKIDGTNAAVGIVEVADLLTHGAMHVHANETATVYAVYAQSRKRLITPADDNYGFARWTWDNAADLVTLLGPGLHFGEWWGQGIQRNYGLDHKRFSLFNTSRWGWLNDPRAREAKQIPDQLWSVPVLHEGPFDPNTVYNHLHAVYPDELLHSPWSDTLSFLHLKGSQAAPGFMNPEGIIVYHTAANAMFKVTLEGDEKGKGE